MNQKALKTLEFDKIIAGLTEYASSALGRELCRQLSPSSSLEEIRTWQAQTTDAVTRVRFKGSVSFSGVKDIGDSLKRLDIGSSLSITELLSISSILTAAARAKATDGMRGMTRNSLTTSSTRWSPSLQGWSH